jgi:hypothetical protein
MTLPAVKVGQSWEHIASRSLWTVKALVNQSAPRNLVLQRDRDGDILACSWAQLHTSFRIAMPSSELGAYVGGGSEDHLADALAFEALLGRGADFLLAYGDEGVSANTFRFAATETYGWPATYRLALAQPITAPGWDMAAAAAGAHDAVFETAVANLAELNVQQRIVDLRIGWEMNIENGYPWSVGGDGTNQSPANYVATFRRLALMVRASYPNLPITWCPNFDRESLSWYPGDDVVDIVAIDMYCNSTYFPDEFDYFREHISGLDWLETFAIAKGKKVAISEWATNYNTANFITPLAQWLKDRASIVAYHAYWNNNDAFPGLLDDYPAAKAAYQDAFGNP